MIMLLVDFEVESANQAAFEVVMAKLAAATLANEDGTLLYQLASVDGTPGHYHLVELYRDEAALDAHMASAWFVEAGVAMRSLLGKRPRIVRHTAINNSFTMKGA